MPTKNREATLEALKEFRQIVEDGLASTGLQECLIGPNRDDMPDSFTGILGLHIAEFGRSGLSRNIKTAMGEIETVFKGKGE